MPFARTVREQALLAAARRCCICHNFKGRNVEVHHIIPEGDGGEDNFENAIVLCFDCHAEVGHYNPKHPRGTKYGGTELRQHRNLWYQEVKDRRIQPPEVFDLHYNYLVCQSTEALREVANRDLSRVPIKDTLLFNSEILEFQKYLVDRSPRQWNNVIQGPSYSSLQEFEGNHPERPSESITPHTDGGFSAQWHPLQKEIERFVAPQEFLISHLTREGVAASEVIIAGVWAGPGCSGVPVSVHYRLRKVWAAYLLVTNATSKSIKFLTLSGNSDRLTQVNYRPLRIGIGHEHQTVPLPPALIRPNQSILVPLFTFMPPWEEKGRSWPIFNEYFPNGQGQEIRHGSATWLSEGSHLVGPSLWPRSITWSADGEERSQGINTIDLDNLYSIDRYWSAGCCPHLFFVSVEGVVSYGGELFLNGRSGVSRELIRPPAGTSEILIAELEDETTTICEIGGKQISPHIQLEKGQYVTVPVDSQDMLVIAGGYSLRGEPPEGVFDPWKKRKIVHEFLHNLQQAVPRSERAML